MKNLSIISLALFSIILLSSCGGGSSPTGSSYGNETGENGGSGSGSGNGSGSGSGNGSGSGSGNGSGSGTGGGSTYNFTVTVVSGDKYAIDGTISANLTLETGSTYIFTVNGGGHPFRLSTTPDGTHGGGSSLTTGVTISGNVLTFVVPASMSGTSVYYYCTLHSNMGGGTLTIN